MELKQIQCFLKVAKYLNFSVAAEKMFLSQPSLSRHIANLEQELGIRLFERDKQSVTLTAAGNQCLNAARNMVNAGQEIASIAKDLQKGRMGSLRIGYQASARIVLPKILQDFRTVYPNIDLYVEEIPAKDLIHKLHVGELDIAFAFTVIQDQVEEYAYLKRHLLYVDQLVLFMERESFLDRSSARESYSLHDFDTEAFYQISYENNPKYFNFLHSIYLANNFTPWRIEEEDSMNTLMLLIQSGRGVALLPQSTREYYPSAHCISLKNVDAVLPIAAMWRPQNSNPCLPLLRGHFPEQVHC